MLTWIKRFFAAPVFEDESKTFSARVLNIMLLTLLVPTVVGTLATIWLEPSEVGANLALGVILTLIILGLRFLLQRGNLWAVGLPLSLVLWATFTFLAYSGNGVQDPSLSGYFLVITLSILLLGERAAFGAGVLSIASAAALLLGQNLGILTFAAPEQPGVLDLLTLTITMGLTALLLYFAVRSINANLARARRNEQAQREANRELEAIRASLEQRVNERTADLEQHSAQLQITAEVGRAAAAIRDIDELVSQAARLISDNFGFEHVGLFLAEETGTQLTLKAASSEGGQQIVALGYTLHKGQQNIISWVTEQKKARIIEGADTALFTTACLPQVRSELALPLLAGPRLLGALDVQSSHANAFTQADAEIMQLLADQLAVAIENAQLFAQSQAALETERRAYGEISRQAWQHMLLAESGLRYLSDSEGVHRVSETGDQTDSIPVAPMRQAARTGQIIQADESTLAIPIKVRDQVLGAARLCKTKAGGKWTPEEIALLETLADQLSVALESARLYQDTQRRAAREQAINIATAKIRGLPTINAILQRTAEELGTLFGASRATIRLEMPESTQE